MSSAIDEIIKPDTRRLIHRLLAENARDWWPHYVLAFALLFVVSGTTALTAYLMKDVINEVFVNRNSAAVWLISFAVMAIFIVKGAATYFNAIILARIGNNIVARLQNRLYDTVLSQSLRFFETAPIGDMIVRFQHGVSGAREAINTLILSIGRDTFTLIGLVAVMVIQDPLMSLLALVIGPPAVFGVMRLMKMVGAAASREISSLARLMTIVKETFSGAQVIKAFTLEPHMKGEMGVAVAAVERIGNNMARINALTVPLMESLGGVAVALAIMYGGWRVIYAGAEPGAFFSFITALLLAYEPARRLARFNVTFQQNMILVRMVYQTLDAQPTMVEAPGARPLAVAAGAIRFENVSFSYGDAPAVRDLDLEFPAGEITALVGPSGAGKSTIVALIERFRDPQRGRILIDGHDIAGVTFASLRGSLAIVGQDTFLFDGTIRENLRMGRLDADDAEIERAARDANAHDFIVAQPQGYDTPVGAEGGLLSGGQRQRIAIARAMLRDAPILLLDEATSALDSVSEAKVQAALERLMRGRTTIVIAHRLSTVRRAKLIHVIEQGRRVESGSHAELLAKGGLYQRLYELQFAERAEADPAA